jgi:hypothetical protein
MYFSISPSKFDEMVKDGRAPLPRMIDSRKVWDILELDGSFDELPRAESPTTVNSWDDR